jgi:hypothetical protein
MKDESEAGRCGPLEPEIVTESAVERAERLRADLRCSIEAGKVGDPVMASFAALFTLKGLIGIGASVAVSIGSSRLTRTLKPRRRGGR